MSLVKEMTLSYVPTVKKYFYNRSTHNSYMKVCQKLSVKYEHDNKFLTKDDCYIYGLLLVCNSPENLYQINLKKNNSRCEKIKSICQQIFRFKIS